MLQTQDGPLSVEQRVTLDPDQSRHALRVLRLSEADAVHLIDGRGTVAQAKMLAPQGKRAVCQIQSLSRLRPPRPHLTLATAIPKGPRGDAMVNDLAQLGADRLIPLRTQRSVVDPRDAKLEKYQRAAIEAAKQCGRAWMMRIDPTLDFPDAIDLQADLKLVADPAGQGSAIRLANVVELKNVLVYIGPEGGLTAEETALAQQRGCKLWRYNDNILRIETAASAAVAILRSLS